MRRLLTLSLALVAAGAAFWPQSAHADGDILGRLQNLKVAGAYWAQFENALGVLPGIANLHTDGTFEFVTGLDGGVFPFPRSTELGELRSAGLGAYKTSGKGQVTARAVYLFFAPPSNGLGAPTGFPWFANAVTFTVDFDKEFDAATGVAGFRLYNLLLGEDPTDPNQGVAQDSISFTLTRLKP